VRGFDGFALFCALAAIALGLAATIALGWAFLTLEAIGRAG